MASLTQLAKRAVDTVLGTARAGEPGQTWPGVRLEATALEALIAADTGQCLWVGHSRPCDKIGRMPERAQRAHGTAAVSEAAAAAAAGVRATVVLPVDDVVAAGPAVRDAVLRQVPLLVLAACDGPPEPKGPSALGLLASGAVVLAADDAQAALDLALVGRIVAEAALVPVVVAFDWTLPARNLLLAERDLVHELIGLTTDSVASATPLQVLVWGEFRARVPRLLDPAQPLTVAPLLPPELHRTARTVRQRLAAGHAPDLVATAMARLNRATGRPLPKDALLRANGPLADAERDLSHSAVVASAFPQREALRQKVARALGEPQTAAAVASTATVEPAAPIAARRIAHGHRDGPSLQRFWGEYLQPTRAGDTAQFADPWLVAGFVPAGSAACGDRADAVRERPEFDPTACTACGRCWLACPEGALGPIAASTEAWLDAAFQRTTPKPPDKLRRALKTVAARIDSAVADGSARTVTGERLQEAWHAVAPKVAADDAERATFDQAFAAVAQQATLAPAAATPELHHGPHQRAKGSGLLLTLAVDPHTCQGCGVCAAECEPGALKLTGVDATKLVACWQAFEQAPETTGPIMARLQEGQTMPAAAAQQLARACLRPLVGADGAEPGSGARLAARLVLAEVEAAGQATAVARVEDLRRLRQRLQEAVRVLVADAALAPGLERLATAGVASGERTESLAALMARAEVAAAGGDVDARKVGRLAAVARELDELIDAVAGTADAPARARWAAVVGGGTACDSFGRFPQVPLCGPALIEPSGRAFSAAAGLLLALQDRAVGEARLERRARLELDGPPDLRDKLALVERLAWGDLTPTERAACVPVVVLADATAVQGEGLAGLADLLARDGPVRVLLCDGGEATAAVLAARALALGQPSCCVLATSVAEPDHLHAGVRSALAQPRPAFVAVYTPSPTGSGFAAQELVQRARQAVASGVHPLLRREPGAPDPAEAALQARHAQELARELDALRQRHEAELAAAVVATREACAVQVRDRLARWSVAGRPS